jgi:gamma-butyrobetaine dioxygenase/trimethyllysine dioxygenase
MSPVELHDDFLRISIDGQRADFHLRWLRHNCDVDRHPLTGERTLDSSELPDRLSVSEAVLDDEVLRIRWTNDQRTSRYRVAWLREHSYSLGSAEPIPPSADTSKLELLGGRAPEAVADELVSRVLRDGAVIVRRDHPAPETETEAWIAAIEQRGFRTVGTHFGRIEDLRTDNTTNANTDQLGYTDARIQLHTDQPFLPEPPRLQLLQAIRRAERGGENLVADGRTAFRYLESLDADAAHRLTSTPVRFHRKQAQFEREVIAPIVTFESDRFRVRSSYFTVAPYKLPFAEMSAWYRAHDAYVRILRDPRHHHRFRLDPGDVLLYDNHRMLHGREAFTGARWVRGVYFDVVEDG